MNEKFKKNLGRFGMAALAACVGVGVYISVWDAWLKPKVLAKVRKEEVAETPAAEPAAEPENPQA